ncbi:RICIN domain-containing protein [Streptomyces gamaensis]|uniref:RICIN domain-containing protein n=1 Tax=Streptomyces gamaensis TaxID=1763542 RepID=A0ABW0ZE18_9ACTN
MKSGILRGYLPGKMLVSLLMALSITTGLLGAAGPAAHAADNAADNDINLDLDNADDDAYKKFIEAIREKVGTGKSPNPAHSNVLWTGRSNADEVFPVTLTTDNSEVRVFIRASDVYVIGYSSGGDYYAFDEDGMRDRQLDGVRPVTLPFSGQYTQLVRATGPEDGRRSMPNVPITRGSIAGAVQVLDREDPVTGRWAVARALQTVIVTLSESARFNAISEAIRRNWFGERALEGLATLINDWQPISNRIYDWEARGEPADEQMRVGTVMVRLTQLARMVAVGLMVQCADRSGTSTRPRTSRSAAECFGLGNTSLTPLTNTRNSHVYFFSGDKYAEIDPAPGTHDDRVVGGPRPIAGNWPSLDKAGFSSGIDAALPVPGAKGDEAWVFAGDQYARIRYTPHKTDDKIVVGPLPIKDNWPSLTKAGFDSGVDAVLPVPGSSGKEAWFFQGDRYVRVELAVGSRRDTVKIGPLPIAGNWPSLTRAAQEAGGKDHYADFTQQLTGAMPVPDHPDDAYFFSGSQYVRIKATPDSKGDRIVIGPKTTAQEWPSLVDAGFFVTNGRSGRDAVVKKDVFTDDFNGPAGSQPDPKNWGYEIGGHGWGNKERQYYTDSADNAHLDGEGHLVIEARKDNTKGLQCHYGPCEVTSARLVGAGKVTTKYGRVEARVKVTGAKGAWPAFWMLGDNMPTDGWPKAGEIDIMENIGNQPKRLMGTVHGPGYNASGGIGGELISDKPLADDFHTYRVDWGPDRLTWYFDGKPYLSVGKEDLRGYSWVFDHPFYPILNLAVGGDLGGTVTPGDFPTKMLVDYVKISDLGGANPPESNSPTTGKGWRTWRPEAPAVAIRSTADNTVLDVEHGSRDKGAKVVTWDYNDGDNQRWALLRHAWDNDFMYRNLGSQLVLDKDGNGTGVLQWDFTDANNQDWIFANASGGAEGEVQIKNGANDGCLTNKGRGKQVNTEPCRDGDRNQVWRLDDVHRGPDLGKPVWEDWHMESNSLNIESVVNGEVLDVYQGSKGEAAKIVTWNSNGQENQKWRMYRRTTENRFMFRNINSVLVLDKNRSGSQVAQYEFGGSANQEWTFEDTGDGTVRIHNGMGDGCLTNTGHGNQVSVTPCKSDDRSQMWRLKESG